MSSPNRINQVPFGTKLTWFTLATRAICTCSLQMAGSNLFAPASTYNKVLYPDLLYDTVILTRQSRRFPRASWPWTMHFEWHASCRPSVVVGSAATASHLSNRSLGDSYTCHPSLPVTQHSYQHRRWWQNCSRFPATKSLTAYASHQALPPCGKLYCNVDCLVWVTSLQSSNSEKPHSTKTVSIVVDRPRCTSDTVSVQPSKTAPSNTVLRRPYRILWSCVCAWSIHHHVAVLSLITSVKTVTCKLACEPHTTRMHSLSCVTPKRSSARRATTRSRCRTPTVTSPSDSPPRLDKRPSKPFPALLED